MAKSSVRAIKVSVDRLGYESLKPELETVVLRRQECFCSFAYELQQIVVATANRCVTLVFHTLLTVSSF